MAYVDGFEHDIFLSYAGVDDKTATEGERGWVTTFEKHLRIALEKRIGRSGTVKIWGYQHRIDGNQLFDRTIEVALDASAVFLALTSNGYLASEYCLKELTCFHRSASDGPIGLAAGDRVRIFNVLLTNVGCRRWPSELAGMGGFKFHDAEPPDKAVGEPLEPGSRRFKQQLRKLVDALDKLLSFLRDQPRRIVDRPEKVEEEGEKPPPGRLANAPQCTWDARLQPPLGLRDLLQKHPEATMPTANAVRGSRATWRQDDEYAVLERLWEDKLATASRAMTRLADAAVRLLDEANYPLALKLLRDVGVSEGELQHLVDHGVIIFTENRLEVRVFHDRMLAWLLAEGLVSALNTGRLEASAFRAKVRACSEDRELRRHLSFIGYVPMDVLWLLTGPEDRHDAGVAQELLKDLEEHRGLFELLPSLGRRIVRGLVSRLRSLDIRSSRAYLEVLKAISDPLLAKLSADLLQSPDVDQQLMAAHVLQTNGTPDALPRLWKLYSQWLRQKRDPPEVAGTRPEEPEILYGDLEAAAGALLSCVRLAPAWLESAIEAADPEVLDELVSLLPRVEGGEEIWHKIKRHAFAVVQQRRERLVDCIESFQDADEIPWLEEQIRLPERNGDVRPRARRALYLLAPERALRPTRGDVATDYWWSRRWWLTWPQLERPEESRRMLKKLAERHGAWQVASLFRGRTNWVPPEILEGILDQTADRLTRELAETTQENQDPPLHLLLSFLSQICHPDLLQRLCSRRGTTLEVGLADWLIREGPNESRVERAAPVKQARLILQKIAGDEITRVAAMYLERAETYASRQPGVDLAQRRWNEDCVQMLADFARQEMVAGKGRERQFPFSQESALIALATIWHNEALVRGLLRLGLDAPPRVEQYIDGRALAYEALEPALRAIMDGAPRRPGAILALGFSGRSEHVATLHRLFAEAEDESDTEAAQACLVALGLLGDRSSTTIEVLLRGFDQPNLGFVAWRALAKIIDVPVVADSLFERLKSRPDHALGVSLLYSDSHQAATAAVLWRTYKRRDIVRYFSASLDRFAILDQEDVRQFLRQEAFQEGGHPGDPDSQYSAIRGLRQFDRENAFAAARAQLAFGSKQARRFYPRLLLEIDTPNALSLLRDLLARSGDLVLVLAAGEAMEDADQVSSLRGWLHDDSSALRQGAAIATNGLTWTHDLDDALLGLCRDRVRAVQTAAVSALETLREDRWSRELLNLWKKEGDTARLWALIEAAAELRIPGVTPYGVARWLEELPADVPYAMRKTIEQRFEDRRKKFIEHGHKEKREW